MLEEWRGLQRDRREALVHDGHIALLDLLPLREEAGHAAWQNPVHDDEIRRITEEMKVGERPLRFLDDHLLEIEDEAHRAARGIGQDVVQVL